MAKKDSVEDEPSPEEFSRVMTALGRRGGRVKVTKGFGTLTKDERTENARRAAEARWGTKKKAKPASKKAAKKKRA